MKISLKKEDENFYKITTNDMQEVLGTAFSNENAKLFTAAPELLEVCKKALGFVQSAIELGTSLQELENELNNAIKKVEG